MRKVNIWCDGSAWPNPGPGGWGAVIRFPDADIEVEIRGRSPEPTTNNRMELTAAIRALESLKEWCAVEINTDSQYLQRGASEWMKFWHARGWKKKWGEIPNADLWRQIWTLCLKHSVKWTWVRGHSDCVENCRADALAELT